MIENHNGTPIHRPPIHFAPRRPFALIILAYLIAAAAGIVWIVHRW